MHRTHALVLGILGLLIAITLLLDRPWSAADVSGEVLVGRIPARAGDVSPVDPLPAEGLLDESMIANERREVLPVGGTKDAGSGSPIVITGSCSDTLGATIPFVELSFLLDGLVLGRSDIAGAFSFIRRESASSVCGRTLVAYRLGYQKAQVVLPPAREGTIDLGRITLAAGAEISGLVTTENRPLPSCSIYLLRMDPDRAEANSLISWMSRGKFRGSSVMDTNTGPDGRFRFVGAPLGDWEVWVIQDPYRPAGSAAVSVQAGARADVGRIDVQSLPADQLITGELQHPDGTLCREGSFSYEYRHEGSRGATGVRRVEEGRFILPARSTGGHYALIGEPGPDEPFTSSEPVRASAGTANVVLRLQLARSLTLTVVDVHGRPVEEFGYRIDRFARTDASAWCHGAIEHHPGGVAKLRMADESCTVVVVSRAYHDGSTGKLMTWDDADVVKVVLEERPRIEGRVVTPGEPLAKVLVQVAPQDLVRKDLAGAAPPWKHEQVRSVTADEQGGFVLYVDAPGEYSLGITSVAYQTLVVPSVAVQVRFILPDIRLALANDE